MVIIVKRLTFILNTNMKMAALHSFINFHLQYCPLVWANRSKGWMSSLEKLQERGLRFVYNNCTTPYVDLLRKAHIPSVFTAWQRSTRSFPCNRKKCTTCDYILNRDIPQDMWRSKRPSGALQKV